jgi:D-alanyl-D-alanine-carboxypeptidase/D-alanyl-D-alanine-endopeptidase
MVAKNELAFNDPVAKFLPEGEVKIPARNGKEITLLDLATHRSALPGMPENFSPADATNPYADYTVEQMYEFLSNHELRRDIGSEAEYSNLGVGLLGHVLARVNGSSYEVLVRERILDPLGMNNTAITLSDDMRHWLVKGHDQAGNVVSNWDIPTLAGAGALRSDVSDMLKFIAANTGAAGSPLEEAMRDSHDIRGSLDGNVEIGLNWFIMPAGEDKVIWHNGGTGGYYAFIGFDADRGVGAIVLTNSSHDTGDIGLHLINSNLPLRESPAERTEVEVSAEVLETYVGEYPLAAEFVLTITVDDGTIWSQATGQEKLQMYPESETEFFLKVVDAQVTFNIDDSGSVAGLVLYQGGVESPAPKQ